MSSRMSHKRAAEHNAEASTSKSEPNSKKTRFVEPSEDPANFAEQVDSALEDPSTKRKGRVKHEGYDSDSSDDGEGVVLSRRKAANDDEDEDMFAPTKEKDDDDEPSIKKKEEYLRLGDIAGQEFGEEQRSDLSEVDEAEDEDDAERKKKAGMGFELSSFNMREEMEEGKFTEDGTYVRSFDPHGVHDRWMEGLSEKDLKLARRRKRQQDRQQKERMLAEEKELEDIGGKNAMEKELLPLLKKGETVLEALQRLGAKSKSRPGWKSSKSNAKHDGSNMQVDKSSPSDIETITHLASAIMSLGETDIYSKTYEELVRNVRLSGTVDPSWSPPSADVRFEYKWDVPEVVHQDAPVFGPFTEDEMRVWYKAAYFGKFGEKVKVRPVGGDWDEWDNVLK